MVLTAIISDDGVYRYRLEREWDKERDKVAFLMLNPSTANATLDDPTIRRCVGFAKSWGFGGIIVGNLFAVRATSPRVLYGHADPVGPDNDEHLRRIALDSETIVCAWGNHGNLNDRADAVYAALDGCNLAALTVTGKGEPGHPLYVPALTQPKAYFRGGK